jgi:hypothetical protein
METVFLYNVDTRLRLYPTSQPITTTLCSLHIYCTVLASLNSDVPIMLAPVTPPFPYSIPSCSITTRMQVQQGYLRESWHISKIIFPVQKCIDMLPFCHVQVRHDALCSTGALFLVSGSCSAALASHIPFHFARNYACTLFLSGKMHEDYSLVVYSAT